jgi:four helix bundle protein
VIGDLLVDWRENRLIGDWHLPCLIGGMTPEDLKARTKKFAVEVIRFARSIPRDPITAGIASQPTDAAASVAAHYRTVCRARSRADFINKLSGAIEEVDESALWLEILAESGICVSSTSAPLWQEADELTRILVRSRETARANRQSAQPPNRKYSQDSLVLVLSAVSFPAVINRILATAPRRWPQHKRAAV